MNSVQLAAVEQVEFITESTCREMQLLCKHHPKSNGKERKNSKGVKQNHGEIQQILQPHRTAQIPKKNRNYQPHTFGNSDTRGENGNTDF